MNHESPIGEVVLPTPDLDACLAFFVEELRFRLDTIFPADAPRVAMLQGHGLRLRLELDSPAPAGHLRVVRLGETRSSRTVIAPNGTRVELVTETQAIQLPDFEAALVISRLGNRPGHRNGWNTGRAGMLYRDLVPGRLGGRFIASHIKISEGGPVPDYVHFHRVHFQLIFCYRGWVRLVYEDQGPPFVMQPGDCVLQPPGIRHRVLESSAGLEVVELGSPAEHETFVEHELELPTEIRDPDRRYADQRFVHHIAADATWTARVADRGARDTGLGAATGGLVDGRVVRNRSAESHSLEAHQGELAFRFLTAGHADLHVSDEMQTLEMQRLEMQTLGAGDAFTIPPGLPAQLVNASPDLEYLEVTTPTL